LNNFLFAENYEKFSSTGVSTENNYIALETPHNTLHDIIGGEGGNMSDISISAFDPLFWLHHCNMDRHFYTWLYKNTEHFIKSLYPNKITKESYNSTQAPFFENYVYSIDFDSYNYGWENSTGKFMLMKDTLDVKRFPFTYDIIEPTLFLPDVAFIELLNIPIPKESLTIEVYIYKKTEVLNKDINFAGSVSWLGIDRSKRFCKRCQVARTNFKIDIQDYILENGISKSNIDIYNILIEGEGIMGYKKYSKEEIVQDGIYKLIL